MTVEDYYAVTVEGDRKQLVDGAIVVNEPTFAHWRLQSRLIVALSNWAAGDEGRGVAGGPTDVAVSEHNVFGPDVIWFADRRPALNERGYPERLPDLCVEIRSPGTWRYDVGAKKRAYEAARLPELWLVDDAAPSVLVFRRSSSESPEFDVALELANGDTLESPQLPGFALAVSELFAEL